MGDKKPEPLPPPRPEVRAKVRDLLGKSASARTPPAKPATPRKRSKPAR